MSTALLSSDKRQLESILPIHDWAKLAEIVRDYAPHVVVLVARKMPRLMESLGLDFGRDCIVISDIAIPYAHRYLRDARVAIIDDVVNVGSTLHNAYTKVQACGSQNPFLIALAAKEPSSGESTGPLDNIHMKYVCEKRLTKAEHMDFSRRVPLALGFMAKPYDLEFPIIKCRFTPPFTQNNEIFAWLRERFGAEATHRINRPIACEFGLSRFTVDIAHNSQGSSKLRFYLDEQTRTCNLVPFAIPATSSILKTFVPKEEICRRIYSELITNLQNRPKEAELFNGESEYRLALFLRSLDFGMEMLDQVADILTIDGYSPLSVEDAVFLFGPDVSKILVGEQLSAEVSVKSGSITDVSGALKLKASTSPFFEKYILSVEGKSFLESVKKVSKSPSNRYELFAALFEELSKRVGAFAHGKYELNWPYSPNEIKENPYLRLRIGPNFGDIVKIMDSLWCVSDSEKATLPNQVSKMLDWAIDEGAVVPTVAEYDGHFYRIYRKGESDFRDAARDRVIYSLSTWEKEISLTRLAKILAILSFSNETEKLFQLSSLARGNVATFQTTVVDTNDTEIAHYLRDIGRLKRT